MKWQIKAYIRDLGADVCGIAGIERFDGAPAGFSPQDVLPGCRSVIAFGIALPEGVLQATSKLIYTHFQRMNMEAVNRIALTGARLLEDRFGCTAVPVPTDVPYEFWDAARMHGRGLLSIKHAAVLAGLGFLGQNTLLIHPEHGNRLTPGLILTDLALESDPLCPGACPPDCGRCLRSCPVEAIGGGTVEQKACRQHAYSTTERGFPIIRCNSCRLACPLGRGRRTGAKEKDPQT